MKYTNELDKVSYCLGLSFASNLISTGIKEINVAVVADALQTAYEGRTPEIAPDEANKILQEFLLKIEHQRGQVAKEAGKKFLEENGKQEGVVTLPSGLQYKVLSAGNGPKPRKGDTVRCHYEGRLINGVVFDSSYRRKQPAEFPVTGVIAGWVEALQLMPVGSKWQLFIPSELAYGSRGAGQSIGPNETLIFDIELLGIK